MTGGRCEHNLAHLTLKSDCCCSIGLAWGSPCEPCKPEDCGGDCNKGYVVISFVWHDDGRGGEETKMACVCVGQDFTVYARTANLWDVKKEDLLKYELFYL